MSTVTRKLLTPVVMGFAGLLAPQASATEEMVVYGSASDGFRVEQSVLRAEIDNSIRATNAVLRATLDQDLKRTVTPKLEVASTPVRARG